MKSECIYEIIDFPKYHQKILIDLCPERLFRLGMLCTHLSRVALRIIKINHMYLVYKTFGGILENQWFHKHILTLSDLYNARPHGPKFMDNPQILWGIVNIFIGLERKKEKTTGNIFWHLPQLHNLFSLELGVDPYHWTRTFDSQWLIL